ncbi:Gfo/Idh/MocA family oxidoreductase [Thermostilla marina]
MRSRLTRRRLLKSAVAASSILVVPSGLVRGYTANEKVNIGIIGSGGRGGANLQGVSGENIVALCDVDSNRLGRAAQRFPQAHTYQDYRELLDKEKTLDAVVVSTPDHMHAPISIRAMRVGLHCYCEKPLTHDVLEARQMVEAAQAKNLVTHMGTPGRGEEHTVRTVEIIRSGALGDVLEAHYWTNRPIWPQGFDRPEGEDPVPDTLDWNLWIGSAPMRPFKDKWPENHPVYQLPGPQRKSQVYHPFVWRGWWDFGTGALGDIAPHAIHTAYWGLELTTPVKVEVVERSGPVTEMFPLASVICFHFIVPKTGKPFKLYWYDGGKTPPKDLLNGQEAPSGGWVIVGSKETIGVGNKSINAFPDVPKTLRRYGSMYEEWLGGIKSGDPEKPSCPFSYAGPLTESYLLGNIALKLDRTIEWDAKQGRISNIPEANSLLSREYRSGFEP